MPGFVDGEEMEYDDMKSERMVIKSAELFQRIMRDYESLREFQRELRGIVSVSTLSNWTQKHATDAPWEAVKSKVEAVARVLGCALEDIASYPTPKPPPMNSRFLLRVALGGPSAIEQWMDLDVCGEELSLQERDAPTRALRGNVLTAGDDMLTGHLRIFTPWVSATEGESSLLPEEMTIQAKWEGDKIRGAMVVRNRKGEIRAAVFEGIRKGVSRRGAKRAARC